MGNTFILDENILISALKCSPMANKLLIDISSNGHSLALHNDLSRKYWSILKNNRKSIHHPQVQRYIGDILHDNTKCQYLGGPFKEQEHIPIRHRNDVFLVQIAYAVSGDCIIVSSDGQTRNDLIRLGLKALPLHEAVKYAGEMLP
ncbi:MAG: hypothetical protein JXA46_07215 [Dehalococcoidales bacterium]|nr:hypothetical protein [Dehalococcoidales bacterium]